MAALQEAPTTLAARSRIFDIPIELGRPDELLQRITGWVGERRAPRRVMYVNAHVLNQSREHPALRERARGRRPRLLRRLRRAARRQGARAPRSRTA